MATTTLTSVPTTGPAPIYTPAGVTQPGAAAVLVSNLDATNPVFLGGPTVAATTGIKLAGGATLVLPSVGQGAVYAIATGAAVNVVVGVF